MITKLLAWIPVNMAGILGIVQAVIKFIKEVLTLAIDLLLPIIPGDKFDKVVYATRDIVNKIDEIVEKIKNFFLQAIP